MLAARVCERVRCAKGTSSVDFRDEVGVESVAGVFGQARVWGAIGCGCTPLELGTRTLGVCTAGISGEIGGGAGIRGIGLALVQDNL